MPGSLRGLPSSDGETVVYEAKSNYQNAQLVNEYDATRFSGWKGKLFAGLQNRSLRALLRAAAPARLLDVPCGTGRIFGALTQARPRVIGGDVSMPMLRVARAKLSESGASDPLAIMDAERLPLKGESIDCICSLKFFHLLPLAVQLRVLHEFLRVTRGYVIVSVPVFEARDPEAPCGWIGRAGLLSKKRFVRDLRRRFQLSDLEVVDLRYTLRGLSNDSLLLLRRKDEARSDTSKVIERHVRANARSFFSDAMIGSPDVRVVVHPSVSAHCFRVDVQAADSEPHVLFAKVCAKYSWVNEAEVELENLRLFHTTFQSAGIGAQVPRPYGIVPDANAILMEWISAVPLRDVLTKLLSLRLDREGKTRILDLVEKSGRWLRIFHEARMWRGSTSYGEAFGRYLKHHLAEVPQSGSLARVLARYRGIADNYAANPFPQPMEVSQLHADFGFSNILVRDGEIVVVDLGLSMRDSIFVDVTYFLVSLETAFHGLGFLARHREFIGKVQDTFLEAYLGYGREPSPFETFLIDFYACANLIRRCSYQLGVASTLPLGARQSASMLIQRTYSRRLERRLDRMERFREDAIARHSGV